MLQFPFEAELNIAPSQAHFATVEKLVRLKFLQGNPRLPLISELSAVKKMERMEAVRLLDTNKLTSKKKKNLLTRLDKIFDMVVCQCKIIDCDKDHDCPGAQRDSKSSRYGGCMAQGPEAQGLMQPGQVHDEGH